jgi:hypothetical protein
VPIVKNSGPTIRTTPQAPFTGGAAQPMQAAGGMHTAVQLTFAFEIAALQLTPTFRMGALQLRPISRVVSMRLAPTQQPQPAMNLQVSFEMAGVQLAGNAIGTLRLIPSQQQRPNVTGSSAFNIAGLQLLSGSENAAVQLTPAGEGQAGVQVTGRFQIATVEFSRTFEIAALVLNSTSRQVAVQLPGSTQAPESAPMFNITNVQLTADGHIAAVQLSAVQFEGHGQRAVSGDQPTSISGDTSAVKAEVSETATNLSVFHGVLSGSGMDRAEHVTPCLRLSYELPPSATPDEFVERAVGGELTARVDVTEWVGSSDRLDDCVFLALYDSGSISPLAAHFVSEQRRVSVVLRDPVAFIDPAVEEQDFGDSLNRGSFQFVALRLPHDG